jgi:solute carrier family 35 protein F1/2
VKAYQYSYITSVTLLDCWTVVWVIILTWYALGTRYSIWQFLGAGTCVAGLALVLLSDAQSPPDQGKLLKHLNSQIKKFNYNINIIIS